MNWLKRCTPSLAVVILCAPCVFAQSGSAASGGGANGGGSGVTASASANGTYSAASADASVSSPPSVGQPSSNNSNNSSSSRSSADPYSPFDASSSNLNLRRMMSDEPEPPELTVTTLDTINQEDCGTWTQIGAHSATVSALRLEVPGKARGVYQKACGEMKKKKLDDAQRDAQKAVDDYPNYPAAWVLLGQVFYNGNDVPRAESSCSKAEDIDPGYVASYLCLAAIAARQREWDQATSLSNHALLLSPLKNAYALYYKAEAAFHEADLRGAEKNALDAAGADQNHQLPEIELLLARIYAELRKSDEAAVRVHNYLKFAHQPADPAAVSAQLAAIANSEQQAK